MSRNKTRIKIPTIVTRKAWWADRTDERGRNKYQLVRQTQFESCRWEIRRVEKGVAK